MTAPKKKRSVTKKKAVKKVSAAKKGATKKAPVKAKKNNGVTAKKNKAEENISTEKSKPQPIADTKSDSPRTEENIFVLKSNLAINGAADFHKTLSELSEKAEPVVFDASAVENIDTAIFQLLLAFALTVKQAGSRIQWLNPSDEFLERADTLGLTDALCLKEVCV